MMITPFDNAMWIGLLEHNGHVVLKQQSAFFRTAFDAPAGCALTLYVSAHSRYRLYLNGAPVVYGPCKGDRWRHFYEEKDVGDMLVAGRNILAAQVVAYLPYEAQRGEERTPMWMIARAMGPAFVLAGCVKDADGNTVKDLGTGAADWEVLADHSMKWRFFPQTHWMGSMEDVDGARYPHGWRIGSDGVSYAADGRGDGRANTFGDAGKNAEGCGDGRANTFGDTGKDVEGCGGELSGVSWEAAANLWPVREQRQEMFGIIPVFPLTKRPIPLMFEKPGEFRREMPIKANDLPRLEFTGGKAVLPAGERGVFELDVGEHTTAFFTIRARGGAGAKLIIRYAEAYSKDDYVDGQKNKGVRDDWANYGIHGHEDTYTMGGASSAAGMGSACGSDDACGAADIDCAGGADSACLSGGGDLAGKYDPGVETYTPFWMRTFRFVRVEAYASSSPLTIYMPTFVKTGYPLEVKTGIEASEPWVAELYEISLRTLQNCMHETYEDCPYYEQLQYIQDSRLEMLFTYAVSGDLRMARRTIEDYHSSKQPCGMLSARYPTQEPHIIPPFSLHWIGMLYEYLWETGDAAFLKHYMPTVDAILQWYDEKIGPLGLVQDLGYWDQIDWVDQWSDIAGRTPASAVGPSTAHNLMYAYALRMGAKLCEAVKRPEMSREYGLRADSICRAVDRLCWSAEAGLYREGPEYEEYSQHSNVYAVLCCLKRGAEARALMERALNRPGIAKCSFTWQFFVFRALEASDAYDMTADLWEMWKGLLKLNLTTIPETPDGEGSPRSDCHAWSALPLHEFPRRMLGVRAAAYGWSEMYIKPNPLGLALLSGDVTTPRGVVSVKLERVDELNGAGKPGATYKLTARAPDGVPTTVIMPGGAARAFPSGGAIEMIG